MKKTLTLLFIFSALLNSVVQAAGGRIPVKTAPSIDAPVFSLVALFGADLTVMRTVVTGDIPLASAFDNAKQCRDTGKDLSMAGGSLFPELRKSSKIVRDVGSPHSEADTGMSASWLAVRRTTGPPSGGDTGIHRSLLSYLVLLSLSNLPGDDTMLLPGSPVA